MSQAEPLPAIALCAQYTRPCKSCGVMIYFLMKRTDAAELAKPGARITDFLMPFNADGITHFATCPAAALHRKRKENAANQQPALFDDSQTTYPD